MADQAVCSQTAEVRLTWQTNDTSEWQATLYSGNNSSKLRTCNAAWVDQGQKNYLGLTLQCSSYE